MIRSIIIDDQQDALVALSIALEKYCPEVQIVGTSTCASQGIMEIRHLKPDLVFLDIQMPDMSGFELLKELKEIDFDIIFVTAYEEYALKAIKFSALDYLLKPVDADELIKAITKVKIPTSGVFRKSKYQSAIENIFSPSKPFNRLAIPTLEGITFIVIDRIIYCRADRNYTTIMLTGNERILVAKSLKDFENMLTGAGFCRVHNNALINIEHVKKYVRGEGGFVVLTDGHHVDISRRKKENFLQLFDTL